MNQTTKKRRGLARYLIYPKFQLVFIAWQALAFLGVLGLLLFSTARSFANLKTMGVQAQLPTNHVYFDFIALQAKTFTLHILLATLLAFLFSATVSLILSHRLAGPIVRTKKYFEVISDQKKVTETLQFRNDDFFDELPPAINQALTRLNK